MLVNTLSATITQSQARLAPTMPCMLLIMKINVAINMKFCIIPAATTSTPGVSTLKRSTAEGTTAPATSTHAATTSTPGVSTLNGSTVEETTAPATSTHNIMILDPEQSTTAGVPLSNVPLIATILPPVLLLVLIGTLLILIIAMCARRKLVKKRALRQDAYYSAVGPPSLPTRTVKNTNSMPRKDDNTKPLYWTIADVKYVVESSPNVNGADLAIEKSHNNIHVAEFPSTVANADLSPGSVINSSSDGETSVADTTQEVQTSQPVHVHIVAARNPAYGTNITIAPEIGTEVNVAYGSSSGSDHQPYSQSDVAASILTGSNPAYGTNVSIAVEIATQRNMAYEES